MTTSVPEFTIIRAFNAPRELVWRAWTEEKKLRNLVAFNASEVHLLRRTPRRTLPLHNGKHRDRRGVSNRRYVSRHRTFRTACFHLGLSR